MIRHELYDELQQLKDHMQLMQTAQTARDNERRKRKGLASNETAETADELSTRAVSTQSADLPLRHGHPTAPREDLECILPRGGRRRGLSQQAPAPRAGCPGDQYRRPHHEHRRALVRLFISNNALALFRMFSQLLRPTSSRMSMRFKEDDEVLVYDMGNIRCVRRMMAWQCGEEGSSCTSRTPPSLPRASFNEKMKCC